MDPCQCDERSGPENVPRSLPLNLLAPTYQNRLRTIGRSLDLGRYRSITILEVDGGFICRAVSRRDRDIELLEFLDDDFPELMILATEARGEGDRGEIPSPFAPTGWEDLLRAIGRWLDENHAAHVVIVEGTSAIVVSGETYPPEGSRELLERVLDLAAVTELLDSSFRQRGRERSEQGRDG